MPMGEIWGTAPAATESTTDTARMGGTTAPTLSNPWANVNQAAGRAGGCSPAVRSWGVAP
jgi:hypothetical protein